jgi:asparagine synthase (glutamine-hydrolysing)
MTDLGAVMYFDGRPAAPEMVRALVTPATAAGERLHNVVDGSFGLACAGPSFLPAADTVTQPMASADDRLRVVFTGRLDNRAELIAALRSTPCAPRTAADAEVFTAAAAAWGASAWDRLLGDFAAIVVDRERRTITGVRDAFGLRPLFYRALSEGVAFASSVTALARLGPVSVDEEMMGQYLSGAIIDVAGSSCREIRRVPPGHAATFASGTQRIVEYASFPLRVPDESRPEDDYAEELRDLLERSVAARLRPAPGGILLSGGIDSAAIAALTPSACRAGLRSYSMVLPGSAKDEGALSDAVAGHLELTAAHTRVAVPGDIGFDFRAHVARTLEPPPPPTALASMPMRRRIRDDGVGVLLSGIGGDELFTGSWHRYADFLCRGQWLTLLREWRQDRTHRLYEGDKLAAISAVGPLVPRSVRPLARRMARIDPVPSVISRRFAARVHLDDRLRLPPLPAGCHSYAQGDILRLIRGGPVLDPLEQEQRLAHEFGADERFPYIDRRIVEFALRLPERLRWRNGQSKVVLRRAVAGRVPAVVQRGAPIHDYSFLLIPSLRQLAPAHADRLRVVARGWVDRAQANQALAAFHSSTDAALDRRFRLLWVLWQIVSTELLLEAFERRTVERLPPIQYTPVHGDHHGTRELERTSAGR